MQQAGEKCPQLFNHPKYTVLAFWQPGALKNLKQGKPPRIQWEL